jgi:hypothetical protein
VKWFGTESQHNNQTILSSYGGIENFCFVFRMMTVKQLRLVGKGQRRGMCVCELRARESAETSRGRCGRNSNVAPLKNQPLKKAGFDSHERI